MILFTVLVVLSTWFWKRTATVTVGCRSGGFVVREVLTRRVMLMAALRRERGSGCHRFTRRRFVSGRVGDAYGATHGLRRWATLRRPRCRQVRRAPVRPATFAYDSPPTVFTQTDPAPLGAGSPFESAYGYGGNSPALYSDPSGLRKQSGGSGWGWAGAIAGGVKGGLGAVAKTPGALYDATVAFPSNLRKLPAGIAAACNEYRGSNGGAGGAIQCATGVIATGTGIDALTNAMIDCINYTVPGMTAAEYQCIMTRHGISATTQAFVTAKAVGLRKEPQDQHLGTQLAARLQSSTRLAAGLKS